MWTRVVDRVHLVSIAEDQKLRIKGAGVIQRFFGREDLRLGSSIGFGGELEDLAGRWDLCIAGCGAGDFGLFRLCRGISGFDVGERGGWAGVEPGICERHHLTS